MRGFCAAHSVILPWGPREDQAVPAPFPAVAHAGRLGISMLHDPPPGRSISVRLAVRSLGAKAPAWRHMRGSFCACVGQELSEDAERR